MAHGVATVSLIYGKNPCLYIHFFLFVLFSDLWGHVGGWSLVQLPIPAYKAKQPFILSVIPPANLEPPPYMLIYWRRKSESTERIHADMGRTGKLQSENSNRPPQFESRTFLL